MKGLLQLMKLSFVNEINRFKSFVFGFCGDKSANAVHILLRSIFKGAQNLRAFALIVAYIFPKSNIFRLFRSQKGDFSIKTVSFRGRVDSNEQKKKRDPFRIAFLGYKIILRRFLFSFSRRTAS